MSSVLPCLCSRPEQLRYACGGVHLALRQGRRRAPGPVAEELRQIKVDQRSSSLEPALNPTNASHRFASQDNFLDYTQSVSSSTKLAIVVHS